MVNDIIDMHSHVPRKCGIYCSATPDDWDAIDSCVRQGEVLAGSVGVHPAHAALVDRVESMAR